MRDNGRRIDYPLYDSRPEWLEADNLDAPGGILSPSDRRLLAEGPLPDADPNRVRQQRYQLRQRYLRGLQDVVYFLLLRPEDKEQLFTALTELEPDARERIWEGFIQLGYNLLYPLDGERFENLLGAFIQHDKQTEYYFETGEFLPLSAEVTLQKTDEPMSIAELERKREAGEELPPGAEFILSLHQDEE